MRLFHRDLTDTAYQKGLQGEKQALAYLRKKGYKLLQKRWRCHGGEVDLIMEDQGVIVFVEVKYRPKGRAGDGLMAVTPDKQRRLKLAAQAYMIDHDLTEYPVRFDVVEITRDGFRHVANAFGA